MGCGTTGASCTENGDGVRIRRYEVEDSGHHNAVRLNRFTRTGYNSVDVFGPYTTVEYNHIVEPCFSKGDCGGVRTFGGTSLAATEVHDITLRGNVIVDSVGNVDGVKIDYRQPFGMGLYVDNYSRDVTTTGNTIVNAAFTGLVYQRSSGVITGNTLYNNATGIYYTGQINLADAVTVIGSMTGNVLYGLTDNAWTLALDGGNLLASDDNYFFHPLGARADHHRRLGRPQDLSRVAGVERPRRQLERQLVHPGRRRPSAVDTVRQPHRRSGGRVAGRPPVPRPRPEPRLRQPGPRALQLAGAGRQRAPRADLRRRLRVRRHRRVERRGAMSMSGALPAALNGHQKRKVPMGTKSCLIGLVVVISAVLAAPAWAVDSGARPGQNETQRPNAAS